MFNDEERETPDMHLQQVDGEREMMTIGLY